MSVTEYLLRLEPAAGPEMQCGWEGVSAQLQSGLEAFGKLLRPKQLLQRRIQVENQPATTSHQGTKFQAPGTNMNKGHLQRSTADGLPQE
jgi:hypothetical protein